MKNNVIKYLMLVFGFLYQTQLLAQSTVDSSYVFSGYTERLGMFNKMPVAKNAIIFVGNSLTDAGRWKDIAPELPILNRGISGDVSFGVVARLDEIIRHQPRKIFLMIGVNDLKRAIPTDYIIRNYEKIVSRLLAESPKTQIYLNSILPINNQKLIESFKSVNNNDIKVLNMALKNIAQHNNKVQFIDLYSVVADSNGELKSAITPDGIHLEVAAYVEVVDYLKSIKVL